jgi:biotin transport system substrate-specific component
MSHSFESTITPIVNLIPLQNQAPARTLTALIFGNLLLTLSSYIEVPMIPVPVTMQTFAVTLLGALYGWRLGGMMIIVWLIEGALGLPVLSGGAGGLHHFVGPTSGYLFSFPIVGILMGWLAGQGWNGSRVLLAFTGMVISNGCCLLLGAAWLASIIGYQQALVLGLTPFLAGGIAKSALGAIALKLLTRTESK